MSVQLTLIEFRDFASLLIKGSNAKILHQFVYSKLRLISFFNVLNQMN